MSLRNTCFLITINATWLIAPPALADLSTGVPLMAQAGVGLVQPEGIQGLAKPARPNMVAEPAPEQQAFAEPDAAQVEAEPVVIPDASPFEIRYLVTYVLVLGVISGGTFLAIRPSGRKPQTGGTPTAKGKVTAAKK